MDTQPTTARECGSCNVCCRVRAILDPELTKPSGVLCSHWKSEKGCSIYEQRSRTCRGHFCGWHVVPQFDDSWRPDRSNIYIELKEDPPEHFRHVLPDARFAFKFTVLGELTAERLGLLAITVGSLIAQDVPVILANAAPPGFLDWYMLLNPQLKPHAAALGRPFMEGFAKVLHVLTTTPPEKIAAA